MIGDVSQRLVDLPIIGEPACSKGLYDPIESKLGICSSVMDERIVKQDDNDETTLRSTSAWSWSLSTGSVTDPLEGWSEMSLVAGGRDMVVLKEGGKRGSNKSRNYKSDVRSVIDIVAIVPTHFQTGCEKYLMLQYPDLLRLTCTWSVYTQQ